MNLFTILNTSAVDVYLPPYPDTRTEKQKKAYKKEMDKRNKDHGLLPR